MSKLITRIALGVLYVVISPIIAIVFVLFLTYGLLIFALYLLKLVFLFFSGKTLFSEFPEDVLARKNLLMMKSNQTLMHRDGTVGEVKGS